MSRRPLDHWLFLPVWLVVLIGSWPTVSASLSLSLGDDRYSYLALIAPISILLIFLDRKRIVSHGRIDLAAGVPSLTLAAVIYFLAAPWSHTGPVDRLWVPVFAIVVMWVASFLLLYGPQSSRAAIFPLCFLLLLIPVPDHLLAYIVYALQRGSAETTYGLLRILGIPVFRNGFIFSVPGIDIEIARECSGIRSSTALFVTGLVAAHLLLRTAGSKVCFVLLIVPVAIFKNAVRISTLLCLALKVDRGFLVGPLHHRGGALFALTGFALLAPLLLLLRKLEDRRQPSERLAPVVGQQPTTCQNH